MSNHLWSSASFLCLKIENGLRRVRQSWYNKSKENILPYVLGFDRDQLMCCLCDAFVDEESIARIIDAFVEHLDIKKLGVKTAAIEGRPSYDPKSLYKLYIYGSRKGIRSSRKLVESCKVKRYENIAPFQKNGICKAKIFIGII